MANFADPTFTYHRALGLMWVRIALSLLTSPVLPGNATDYGLIIGEIFSEFSQKYEEVLGQNGITVDYLRVAVDDFVTACRDYQTERDNLTSSIPDIDQQLNVLRIINDKLINIDRAFIHPEGLPGRLYVKHVIFAPSSINSYDSSLFPGISDAIFNAVHSGGDSESWNLVKRQMDIVRMHLRHASQILTQPSLKYAPKN